MRGRSPAPPASTCSTTDPDSAPRSTALARERDLARFGARQRQELADQTRELIELFELALQPRR